MQGGEDASHHVQRADVVGDEGAHWRRRIAIAAGSADQAASGLAGEVRAFALGIRPDRAKRAALRANDAGIDGREVGVAHAPGIQRARLEVADHYVCIFGQQLEYLRAAFVAQIQADAALAAVAGCVDGAARVVEPNVDVAAVIAHAR